jgi:hypothetical protein
MTVGRDARKRLARSVSEKACSGWRHRSASKSPAFRVAIAVPASNSGTCLRQPLGSLRSRSRSSSAARSELAVRQSWNRFSHSAAALGPAARRARRGRARPRGPRRSARGRPEDLRGVGHLLGAQRRRGPCRYPARPGPAGDDRAHPDDRRPVSLVAGRGQRGGQRVDVVGVVDPLGVPAVRLLPRQHVLAQRHVGVAVDGDVVVGPPGPRRQLQPDLHTGQPDRAGERLRLPHVPAGRLGRQLRGPDHDRPRRTGTAAVPGLHARRPGQRLTNRLDVAHRW